MITFTFAGDEAGDFSFKFEKGASRYVVIAVIATSDPDALRELLSTIRKENKLSPSHEFGFHMEKREGATLILDEMGYPEKTREELKHMFKKRNIQHGFNRITMRRSKQEALIQVADLIAGSILRRDSRNQSEAYDMIAGKIVELIEYR